MKILKLLIILLLIGCEVTFNSNLKTYIEDVSGRVALDFSLEDSFKIENEENFKINYLSFGYNSSKSTHALKFTNNEFSVISITSYTNNSDDFSIVQTPQGDIQPGSQFTIEIEYDPEVNLNKTVNSNFIITDSRDRKYEVILLASSKRQPLDIIFNEEIITGFDFGDKYTVNNTLNNPAKITLYNDSLGTLNIDPITVPGGINLNISSPISIPIFGSQEIELYIEDPNNPLDDKMIIQTDFSQSSYIEFPLYGGGDLNLLIQETDVNGNILGDVIDSYNFGLINPNNDDERYRYFRITNTTDFEVQIDAGTSSDFNITFPNATLQPGDTHDFEIYAPLDLSSDVSGSFDINDINTGRRLEFNVFIQVN